MRKWLKRFLLTLVLLSGLAAVGFIFRAPLLRTAANAWIVDQPLTKADVIVVLGGGPDTRPFAAARLFRDGYAPKVLLMNPRPSAAVQLGLYPSEVEIGREELLKNGIPTNAILVAPGIVTNSFDESIVLRNWGMSNHIQRAIIPTDIFHTRRVRWLYGKELRGSGIETTIVAVPVNQYSRTNWWQREEGIIAFQNEVLKYAYYRLRY
jgi:uncharacterized SAM-binding protein YcdF (DUF218 family)